MIKTLHFFEYEITSIKQLALVEYLQLRSMAIYSFLQIGHSKKHHYWEAFSCLMDIAPTMHVVRKLGVDICLL